ncbi:hypothetical protein [Endozoicomonas sp. 2B-B]
MDGIGKGTDFQVGVMNSSLLRSYRDEPLWNGIPVCTVNCTEKHISFCPDHERSTRLFNRSIELPLSNSCIDFIKYSVGEKWQLMASSLGFTDAEIQELQCTYIRGTESHHNKLHSKLPDFVFLIEAMIRKAQIDKNMDAEAIFNAIERSGHFNKKFYPFREINNQEKIQTNPFPDKSGCFTSYIFLIWIKKDESSLTLPNTTDCPVKQRCYDWAQHNNDKLVVLWYSSSMLDRKEEKSTFSDFQRNILSDGIKNILILDIDNINWGDEERYTYWHIGKSRISETLVFNKELAFDEVIDGLRPVLLSRGSSYIKSAMRESHIHEAQIPTMGAYFDVDYIPVPFKSFYHPYRKICRDGTFDTIFFFEGSLSISGMVPNSFLATYEDNNDLITDYPMCGAYGMLSFYADYRPHLVATTRLFRMSDCKYEDNGQLLEWERQATWTEKYSDETFCSTLSEDKPSLPDYLVKYKASGSSGSDPMVQD